MFAHQLNMAVELRAAVYIRQDRHTANHDRALFGGQTTKQHSTAQLSCHHHITIRSESIYLRDLIEFNA